MKDLEIVADIFNRLLPIARQTDRRVYILETLCGTLNAFGWAVDIGDCNLLVDVHPDGMTADALADAMRTWEIERIECNEPVTSLRGEV